MYAKIPKTTLQDDKNNQVTCPLAVRIYSERQRFTYRTEISHCQELYVDRFFNKEKKIHPI